MCTHLLPLTKSTEHFALHFRNTHLHFRFLPWPTHLDSSTACLPLLSEPPPSVLRRGPFNVLYGDLSGPTMEHAAAAAAAVCATFNTIVNACSRLIRVTILHALATTTFHYIFGQSSGIPTQSCRYHFSLCEQQKVPIPMYIQRANQWSLPNHVKT